MEIIDKIKRKVSVGLIALLSHATMAPACTGAKQMAMGWAGITTSDNTHAIYWNQAMMHYLKYLRVSYTQLIGDTESIRYDDIFSAVVPVSNKLTLGLQAMNSRQSLTDIVDEDITWAKFAGGLKLNSKFSVGCAITPKYTNDKRGDVERDDFLFDYEVSGLFEEDNLLIKGDELRLGFLMKFWSGLDGEAFNLRPGASYTVDDKIGELTIAANYYSALHPFAAATGLKIPVIGGPGIRIGMEQKISVYDLGDLYLRFGLDDSGMGGAFAYGFGYTDGERTVNVAFKNNNGIKYGLLEVEVNILPVKGYGDNKAGELLPVLGGEGL